MHEKGKKRVTTGLYVTFAHCSSSKPMASQCFEAISGQDPAADLLVLPRSGEERREGGGHRCSNVDLDLYDSDKLQLGLVTGAPTGERVSFKEAQLDHKKPMTFRAIVMTFIAAYGIEIKAEMLSAPADNQYVTTFVDKDLEQKFREYHHKVAVLRIVKTQVNRSLGGSERLTRPKRPVRLKAKSLDEADPPLFRYAFAGAYPGTRRHVPGTTHPPGQRNVRAPGVPAVGTWDRPVPYIGNLRSSPNKVTGTGTAVEKTDTTTTMPTEHRPCGPFCGNLVLDPVWTLIRWWGVCKSMKNLVGASGFEPPTSWSRTRKTKKISDLQMGIHIEMDRDM
jgi:hypothetical protein